MKKLAFGSMITLSLIVTACRPPVVPDTAKPTVTLAADKTNVTAAGDVKFTATATDNVGVTKVEFYKGTDKVAEDTTSPYEYTATYTSANNGDLSYTAKAYDAANNNATSAPVSVKVNIPVVDAKLAAQQAYSDAAVVASMTQTLDADTQLILDFYNIKLPTLPGPTALKLEGFESLKNLVPGVDLQQWQKNAVIKQGTAENPDWVLRRGTYSVSNTGVWQKTSDQPTNGVVINFNYKGQQITESTTFNKVIVGQVGFNTYSEMLVGADTTVKKGNTTLVTLSYDTDAKPCSKMVGNSLRTGTVLNNATVSLNVNNKVTASLDLEIAGTKASASGNFKVISGTHTAELIASGEVTSPNALTLTCDNFDMPVVLNGGKIDALLKVDQDSAHLKASLTNFKMGQNPDSVEGDVDASLVFSNPSITGTIFTATGNLKDGADADTKPGDQVTVSYYTAQGNKVTLSLQALLAQLQPPK